MRVARGARLPYAGLRMYGLVNDVPAYPEFLPWCTSSGILEEKGKLRKAFLCVGFKLLRFRLVTQNRLIPGRHIDMRLLEGPFRHLRGAWDFDALGEAECQVTFHMDFELQGRLARRVWDPMFGRLADSMLDAFAARARTLYG